MKNLISFTLLLIMLPFGLAQNQQEQSQLPFLARTIADALRDTDDLQALRVAVQTSRLAQLLSGPNVYTLFAPTNDAFSIVAQKQLNIIINNERSLEHHVIRGALTVEVLRGMLYARGGQMSLPTIGGSELGFALNDNGAIIIGGVAGIVTDGEILANGVILPISNILPVVWSLPVSSQERNRPPQVGSR